jgi:hypothetical protein
MCGVCGLQRPSAAAAAAAVPLHGLLVPAAVQLHQLLCQSPHHSQQLQQQHTRPLAWKQQRMGSLEEQALLQQVPQLLLQLPPVHSLALPLRVLLLLLLQ